MADTTPVRLARLLDLAGYLALRSQVTTGQQIAEAFEVSLRTVYRDVDDLRSIGLPISGECGVGFMVTQNDFIEWVVGRTMRGPRPSVRPNKAERMIAKAMEERGAHG